MIFNVLAMAVRSPVRSFAHSFIHLFAAWLVAWYSILEYNADAERMQTHTAHTYTHTEISPVHSRKV